MRSRFIARMTDIAFQASPPRGVGMLRLVSPSAISRYGFAPHRLDDRLEIEFRRRQRSLSQRELASLVGRSQGQLANAIRGHDPIIVGGGQQAAGRAARIRRNNSVREITGGALQRLSDVKLIPDHSEDAAVGDLADQGPNGD